MPTDQKNYGFLGEGFRFERIFMQLDAPDNRCVHDVNLAAEPCFDCDPDDYTSDGSESDAPFNHDAPEDDFVDMYYEAQTDYQTDFNDGEFWGV